MVCDFVKIGNFKIEVTKRDTHKCRYHKQGQKYEVNQIGPRGMCLEAFYAVYPYSLALLYNVNRKTFSIRCPKGDVIFEIIRKSNTITGRIIFYLKSFIDFFYKVDPRRYRIFIKVKKVEGKCPKNHRVEEEYEFNQNNKRELCPAAFDSIFPYFYAYRLTNKFSDFCSAACQDHLANIVFKIENQPSGSSEPLACREKDLYVKIDNVFGQCAYGYQKNQVINYSSFLKIIKCSSLFHNAFPYIFTFENGGSFKFNKSTTMVVQCPAVGGRVAVDVIRKGNSNFLRHVQTLKNCPKEIKDISLPNLNSADFPLCPRLFNAVFPYINRLKIDDKVKQMKISCPSYPNYVMVEIASRDG